MTGVQTCALPISEFARQTSAKAELIFKEGIAKAGIEADWRSAEGDRSEERRVGKECRSRLSPYH